MLYEINDKERFIEFISYNDEDDECPIIESVDKKIIAGVTVSWNDEDEGFELDVFDKYHNNVFSTTIEENYDILADMYKVIMGIIRE